ncbi:MAG: hypothetical protein QXG35_08800, partial [Nitrososphaerota archaeon]
MPGLVDRRVEKEAAESLKRAKENLGVLLDVALKVRETYIQKTSMSILIHVSGRIEFEHGYICALYHNNLARREDFEESLKVSYLRDELCRLIIEKNVDIREYFWGWQCLKCGAR